LLGQKQYEADLRFTTLCGKITDYIVAEMRVSERESGPVEETVVALLPHLVQHQTHHCGQAHVQLSDAGIPPRQLDDFYLTCGRVPSARAYWG
jgi:hypothetical protein